MKTFLYRIVMAVIPIVVALLGTSDVGASINIGIATNAVKTGAYYAYERLTMTGGAVHLRLGNRTGSTALSTPEKHTRPFYVDGHIGL
jgi:uncharacterized membrane protein